MSRPIRTTANTIKETVRKLEENLTKDLTKVGQIAQGLYENNSKKIKAYGLAGLFLAGAAAAAIAAVYKNSNDKTKAIQENQNAMQGAYANLSADVDTAQQSIAALQNPAPNNNSGNQTPINNPGLENRLASLENNGSAQGKNITAIKAELNISELRDFLDDTEIYLRGLNDSAHKLAQSFSKENNTYAIKALTALQSLRDIKDIIETPKTYSEFMQQNISKAVAYLNGNVANQTEGDMAVLNAIYANLSAIKSLADGKENIATDYSLAEGDFSEAVSIMKNIKTQGIEDFLNNSKTLINECDDAISALNDTLSKYNASGEHSTEYNAALSHYTNLKDLLTNNSVVKFLQSQEIPANPYENTNVSSKEDSFRTSLTALKTTQDLIEKHIGKWTSHVNEFSMSRAQFTEWYGQLNETLQDLTLEYDLFTNWTDGQGRELSGADIQISNDKSKPYLLTISTNDGPNKKEFPRKPLTDALFANLLAYCQSCQR